jgi:Flp pilus assembly protein TadG
MRSARRWVEHIVASLRRFRSDRCGNVAVIFALLTVPLVVAVGISVDYVKASQLRTRMQAALDAAVLAGVAESSSSLKISKATSYFQSQTTNDWSTTPTASFSVDGAGKLIGMAQAAAKASFVGMLGQSSISVNVTAAAVTSGTTSKVCILLVDPTQSQSLLVNSGANLNAPNCEIHVRSTASPAAIFNSGTTLNVKKICIKGSNVIKNGGANPPAETNCAAISDPFSNSMPSVSVGACNHNNEVYNPGSVTLNPGVYCGWTNFNGSGTLTLNPGLYIIKNGGMTFNSGWTVTGNGVTFYLVDQNATITFNGNVNFKFSPPTSGTYANVLMFEPAGLANTNLPINGTSGSNLQGLLYLPSRDVTINSVSNVSADKVTMVFSSLIFNTLNWTFDAGNIAMSASADSGGAPRLTQ